MFEQEIRKSYNCEKIERKIFFHFSSSNEFLKFSYFLLIMRDIKRYQALHNRRLSLLILTYSIICTNLSSLISINIQKFDPKQLFKSVALYLYLVLLFPSDSLLKISYHTIGNIGNTANLIRNAEQFLSNSNQSE